MAKKSPISTDIPVITDKLGQVISEGSIILYPKGGTSPEMAISKVIELKYKPESSMPAKQLLVWGVCDWMKESYDPPITLNSAKGTVSNLDNVVVIPEALLPKEYRDILSLASKDVTFKALGLPEREWKL